MGARSKQSAKSRLGDPLMASGGTGRPWEALGELERRSRPENGAIRLQIGQGIVSRRSKNLKYIKNHKQITKIYILFTKIYI